MKLFVIPKADQIINWHKSSIFFDVFPHLVTSHLVYNHNESCACVQQQQKHRMVIIVIYAIDSNLKLITRATRVRRVLCSREIIGLRVPFGTVNFRRSAFLTSSKSFRERGILRMPTESLDEQIDLFSFRVQERVAFAFTVSPALHKIYNLKWWCLR